MTAYRAVLAIIQEKLNNPSADDPFEPRIAAVLKNDKNRFLATAKEWTKKYDRLLLEIKKSATARTFSLPSPPPPPPSDPDAFPQIPLPDDFRTSLILPDLSRRFSLLRSSSGEPVGLDILRDRLADQRKRGATTQITEEEEELIFDTLRSFRPNSDQDTTSARQSSSTMQSSLSSRSTKRYSNNLFGSGRFNDYNYVRSATKNTSSKSSSSTPTKSSYRREITSSSTTDSLRPSTPPESSSSRRTSSLHSSSIESESSVRSAPLMAPTPYGEQQQHSVVSVAEYRISKALGPSALKRASMALEAAIKEFEEEVEDEILMPRSTPIPRTPAQQPTALRTSQSHSSIVEAVVAISPDDQTQNDPELVNRRSSPVPTRTLPGYVPGMPRPMTPRELDLDEQRSHSTTPRATSSTNVTSLADSSSASVPRHRSNSLASQLGMRSNTSPLFLQRSPNSGRFTPEDGNATEPETPPLGSSLLGRRRPASPLAGPPFQPLAVSSRPTTPSTVIWNTNADVFRSSHSRDDSWTSDTSSSTNIHTAHDRYTSSSRSVHSPPLPDSPTEKSSGFLSALEASFNSMNKMTQIGPSSASPMSITELGSPIRAHQRSVTPTQSASRSPTSPTFPTFSSSTTSSQSQRSSSQHYTSAVPPLVFSPLVNSSRSSLGSDGSSYHSSDAGDEDRSSLLFCDPDTHPSVWHDLSSPPTSVPADSLEEKEKWNPEEVVARATGLKRMDFVAIQEKLLSARDAKEKERESAGRLEPQERAASSLRKRRPSTSQSNYSCKDRESRVASPSPQVSPVKNTGMPNRDRPSSALGNNNAPSSPREKSVFARSDISPITRRNRDLAQALFGHEAESASGSKNETIAQQSKPPAPSAQALNPPLLNNDTHSSTSTLSPTTAPIRVAPYQTARNPSVPRIPQTPQEEAKLVQEVKEKIDAATEFLKPLKSNGGHSPDPQATISRRRINLNQISTPRLVSASTTVVDTIPIKPPSIASANASGPSKIGSRFKKLRGTLRAKNSQLDEPSSTPSLETAGQMANYDPAKLKVPASATEQRFKVPVPSPPASAGPGLKGFMARFRSKQKTTAEPAPFQAPTPPTPLSISPVPPAPLHEKSYSQTSTTTVGRKPASVSRPQTPPLSPPDRTPTQATYGESVEHQAASAADVSESSDMSALRQLFEAADKIGIDQGELTSLLARSGSTSSKANWTALARSNSAVRQGATSPIDHSGGGLSPSIGRPMYDAQSMRALTPDPKTYDNDTGRRSLDGQGSREKQPISRQMSRRQGQAEQTRRPREGKAVGDSNAVVRKTIIVPDTNMTADELKTFMEKSMPGRRLSVTSISSRSVHDRAPTPPPLRSPALKRFSGPSPPVPSLPTALNTLSVPSAAVAGGLIEKSNSTYDSLYDMYAGEGRSRNATPNEPGPSRPSLDESALASDSGAAVELIHLANGETIWNIVNGLREETDDESLYTRRTSFTSEYGARGGDGLQVFVKEHGRSGSRGSTSSFLSRKRSQGKSRPETKVFYAPAEGIGRLIQDLSQNMDAGSFNFALRQGVSGHSPSSSLSTNEMAMSLEERLDKMIDTVRIK
ncbi:hypothetical protein C0995_006934 [Termitomyces sp. Mi166|nr:hypothetical protein C0995_006934 [Termitomyces sp. Mi166\